MKETQSSQKAVLTPPVGEQDHVQGPTAADITLVQYGDYNSARCAAVQPWVKALRGQDGNAAAACDLGLNTRRFLQDMTQGVSLDRVLRDRESGMQSAVSETPTFFLNGERHDAGFVFETLADAVRHQIKTAGRDK